MSTCNKLDDFSCTCTISLPTQELHIIQNLVSEEFHIHMMLHELYRILFDITYLTNINTYTYNYIFFYVRLIIICDWLSNNHPLTMQTYKFSTLKVYHLNLDVSQNKLILWSCGPSCTTFIGKIVMTTFLKDWGWIITFNWVMFALCGNPGQK